jgi:hypothetical protein
VTELQDVPGTLQGMGFTEEIVDGSCCHTMAERFRYHASGNHFLKRIEPVEKPDKSDIDGHTTVTYIRNEEYIPIPREKKIRVFPRFELI